VGSGQALSLGRRGDADVLLTHAQDGERALVADGYAREALPVMYNEFLLVGPEADPAGLGVATDVLDAMRRIREHNAVFVSRGDDSGTHRRELSLWNEAGVDPDFSAYHSAGAGMANALRVASELQGYVLTDIGTWLAHRKRLELREAVRGDALLANPYSVLVISSDRNPGVREDGARRFADFLLRDETQSAIRTFGTDRFGQPLFHTYEEARPLRSAGQP
jgi:tungstate transport system substrate-binding protein